MRAGAIIVGAGLPGESQRQNLDAAGREEAAEPRGFGLGGRENTGGAASPAFLDEVPVGKFFPPTGSIKVSAVFPKEQKAATILSVWAIPPLPFLQRWACKWHPG